MAMAMNPIQVLRGGAEEEKEIDFKMIHYLEFLNKSIKIIKLLNGLKSSK